MNKRPIGLIAIVCYKSFNASLLMVTSIALFLTLKNHDALADFSDNVALESKVKIINWVLDKVLDVLDNLLNLRRRTIAFSAIAAAIYSIVTAIEAVGLWYEKMWAHILVLGLVGVSIPIEVYELFEGLNIIKLVVFMLNIAIFFYLFRSWYDKLWAHILVLTLVGITIPIEILELFHKSTPVQIGFSLVNIGIFGYLLFSFTQNHKDKKLS